MTDTRATMTDRDVRLPAGTLSVGATDPGKCSSVTPAAPGRSRMSACQAKDWLLLARGRRDPTIVAFHTSRWI